MYNVRYDPRVADDIHALSKTLRERLRITIEGKLTTRPEVFGKPLRHSLLGFRSLRIGEYRVVFLIKGQEVLVVLIAHRKHVYDIAQRRAF